MVYAALAAVWLLTAGWQVLEHNQIKDSARRALLDRAQDISNTVGVVVRSQRRFGLVPRTRIEAALEELTEMRELNSVALLNASGETVEQVRFEPRRLMELLDLIDAGTLSTSMAKTVFEEMFETGAPPERIAEERGLVQISDADAVQPAVEEAVSDNPDPVSDYLAGKEVAIKFLVGQVMKITRGKANPQLVAEMLKDKRESMR